MLVLIGDALLDLVELCSDPGIIDVAVRMKPPESCETLVGFAVVNEPTGTFWEEENESSWRICQ